MQQIEASKRRLMREASDLRANPLINCNAVPLESDIFTWHANLVCDKWPNTYFHFTIHFPKDYPKSPPKVKNCTFLDHENVQGEYLCLDMLLRGEKNSDTPWRFWSSEYKVSSLLVQLQEFLFDVDLPNAWSDTRAAREASKFTCPCCNHKPSEPWPPLSKTQLSWECSGACHALYHLERPARIRVGPSKTSYPITECQGGTVLVKEIRGNRAKVILKHHGRALIPGCKNFETGWVSRETPRGPLLTKIMDVTPGVYKSKRRLQVYHCQARFRDWQIVPVPVGKYSKDSIIDIGDVLPFGDILYGVIKGTEKMVEMRDLKFVREFKYKKKKKKKLSDEARKLKWKNPTPRERRRRRYWRNLQAAGREAAKVASAPRGTVDSQVPMQADVYQPTFMLWVPTMAPVALTPPMPSPMQGPLQPSLSSGSIPPIASPSPVPSIASSTPSLPPSAFLPSPSAIPFPTMAGFQLMHQGMPAPNPMPVDFLTGFPHMPIQGHFQPQPMDSIEQAV